MHVGLGREAEPGEHRVDVLLDGPLGEEEGGRDSEAIALATQARVGRLVLIHHAPGRTDAAIHELARRHAAHSPVPVAVGREGYAVDL